MKKIKENKKTRQIIWLYDLYGNAGKIVLDTRQQSMLINNFEQLVSNIAEDLGINQQAALEKSINFFSNTRVTVQPTGMQGKFYKIMQSAQNCVPMIYTSEAVSVLKTSGMSGLQVINQAPLTFVGATYIDTCSLVIGAG